jgi:hypothetical protein
MTIPTQCLKYYKDLDVSKQYGIYNNGLERFVAVSDDLWITHNAAKLLSSKFSSTVCILNNKNITNNNCHMWGLVNNSQARQDQQSPAIALIDQIEEKGLPVDFDNNDLISDKEFVDFVVLSSYALYLTDAICNASNQKFYNKLVGDNILTKSDDDSGIPEGFIVSIEKILYLSASKDEALDKFTAILDDLTTDRPGQLKMYKNIFNSFLGIA